MKGTLFSADFVFDSSDNARLLEINTDTALVLDAVENYLDFTDFGTILSDSAFDTLYIIYKPFHQRIVDKLVAYVNDNVSNITTIEYQEEESCAVYLGSVEDADNKFILRLAYDESAILDSVYAKSELELYHLFNDYNDLGSVPPLYMSSSAKGIVNTLTQSFNDANLPDFVKKYHNGSGATMQSISFNKVGLPETGSDYRFNAFIEDQKADDTVITNYLPNLSGSHTTSVRSMQIVYGTDLDLCFLGEHQQVSLFEIPTSIVTGSSIANFVDRKHKFEFSTNYPMGSQGVRKDSNIISTSGDLVNIRSNNTGSEYFYKSYFVSGSPDTDDVTELNDWYHSGSTFPSGSYITSSNVVVRDDYINYNKDLYKLDLESGDTFYLGARAILPVLDTGSNVIKWESTSAVKVGNKVFDDTNTALLVTANTFQVSDTDGDHDTGHPNMEGVDTYIIKGDTNNLLVHNPFGAGRGGFYTGDTCFLAGTKIDTPNGDINIEDIKVGDIVYSYDTETQSKVEKEVTAIDHRHTVGSHKDACLATGKEEAGYFGLAIDDEDIGIKFTPEHPILTKDGWKCLVPILEQEPWASEQEEVKFLNDGDEILFDGEWKTIDYIQFNSAPEDTPVYNFTVEGTHTYIANKVVVHNK